jgi:hypothetical protein
MLARTLAERVRLPQGLVKMIHLFHAVAITKPRILLHWFSEYDTSRTVRPRLRPGRDRLVVSSVMNS